jgi:nanoRNase/pAp phosphatase (c-di-AMP/oligoRNAs hydrolase)
MISRLLLGCGSIGHAIIDAVAERPGSLLVLSEDAERVEALRDSGIAAEHADPTNPVAIRGVTRPIDVLLVASDDSETNLAAARAGREAYPDALVVTYAGTDPAAGIADRIEGVADRMLDPGSILATDLLERSGEEGLRLRRLRRVLGTIEGTLAVVAHDNPDPDAIASAVALARIAEAVGCEAKVCYFGDISHQENRAFVNLLDLDLVNLNSEIDLEEYGGFALVDHSRPGVNDGLPEDTPIDVVIDHHPPRAPVEARFVDLRSDVGATSTLLVDYLQGLGIEPDTPVGTGLLYGIRVDTKDFTREISAMDFEAAAYLLPRSDGSVLEQVEAPSISAGTLEIIARAIRNRELRETVLTSNVGRLADRDALAQAADQLLGLGEVSTTLIYGFRNGTIYVSARARGAELDLGETLRDAFEEIGSAGGHAGMAGAQIPLGILAEVEDDEEPLAEIVHDVITVRFYKALRSRPTWDSRLAADGADSADSVEDTTGGRCVDGEADPDGSAVGDPDRAPDDTAGSGIGLDIDAGERDGDGIDTDAGSLDRELR